MTETLGVQPWMTAPGVVAVMDALVAAGGADAARFVGGCVRNTLLGAPISDIDIATVLTPDAVTAALKSAGLRAVPTGVEHGTVTAVAKGQPFEITTLRRDVETDGRRAVVAFTTDWAQDAQRRDFTLNALYADRTGAIFDGAGRGVADARAGRIVFVGEPEQRLREDHLRILRFFRFLAWYGRGEPDAAALAACEAMRGGIAALAAERISKELLKLLAAPDPRAAVALMKQTGVLKAILPAWPNLPRFHDLVEIDTDPLLRLAALLPDDPAQARAFAEALRLSNAQRDRLIAALTPDPAVNAGMTEREVRRAIYPVGAVTFRDRLKLAWAVSPCFSGRWSELIAQSEAWTRPAFPLSGEDVMAAGVAKGPMVGETLRAVETWWIDEDFRPDRTALLAKLKTLAA